MTDMKNINATSVLLPNYEIFVKPDLYDITNKQYEEWRELCEFIQWGRKNPVLFAEEVFGIEFLDYQKYVFEMTWRSNQAVWCMSRNAGKSILGAIYMMTRSLLIPNHQTYICSNVGAQSIDTFTKIEKLTKNAIPSFKSLTNVFAGEIVKPNAKGDGFGHDPSSYHVSLYNGSQINTLNGNIGNTRGKRSNLNFYDECMNCQDELFTVTEPFTTQNTNFALGVDFDESDMLAEPPSFPNQLIYASSAGRTDQYFYKKYRECSLHMDAGDSRYFCADIDCNVVLGATKRGVELPEPLLTQDRIDSAMSKDKQAAMREYMNIFTSEGGDGQIIRRATVLKNSYPYMPIMYNKGDELFCIAYDPARRNDNSTVLIGKFYQDEETGWHVRLANCIVLMDRMSKKKRMMNTPNQVEELKQIIVDYNGGKGVADYENILAIMVDSGSGGAGVPITDFIAEDYELNGVKHRGLVDPEYNEGDDKKFPNAISNKLHLISPLKFKSEMFESAIQMVDMGLVEFPEEYNGRGYVTLIYEVDSNGNETQRYSFPSEEEEAELKKRGIDVITKNQKLSIDEEAALVQLDALKTEVCNIYRFKGNGSKDRFDLAPDKANILNDDRAYCFALMCYYLAQLRRQNIVNKKREQPSNLVDVLPIRKAKINKRIG